MKRLKLRPEEPAERHLTLVPPAKRKRRKRWKLPRNLRTSRKLKYGQNPELLKYEETLVMAAVREQGGRVSVWEMMEREPDRWNEKYLWLTLRRLARQGRLVGKSWQPADRKVRPREGYSTPDWRAGRGLEGSQQ
jgi:hypothetical protein